MLKYAREGRGRRRDLVLSDLSPGTEAPEVQTGEVRESRVLCKSFTLLHGTEVEEEDLQGD